MRRNTFNLSHEHKLTTDMGWLVPVQAIECLPGDTMQLQTSLLARVAPLVNPVMHHVEIRVHHWYVPNRILWDGWEDFIVGKVDTTVPTITTQSSDTLIDHLGIPPFPALEINALPIRAYNMIWNEFYRDQDLSPTRSEDNAELARICWEKDYFTIARPEPQQGEGTEIPLGIDTAIPVQQRSATDDSTQNLMLDAGKAYAGAISSPQRLVASAQGGDAVGGIDINQFRRAMALQRFAEARAKYGERYVDYLRFLGVNPSDGRLDRPEYLGGGKQNINFSEVLATAEGTNTNVGDMSGHGIAGVRTRRARKMFEEHGWVLSLLSARPKTVYMDNVPKKYLRSDVMDYWQKELEILPWQEIRQNEVHYNGDPDTLFGYIPRYSEYRHELNYVSNGFREAMSHVDWHMARTFQNPPALNHSFVECTPTDRIFAAPEDGNDLIINAHNRVTARRLVRATASI